MAAWSPRVFIRIIIYTGRNAEFPGAGHGGQKSYTFPEICRQVQDAILFPDFFQDGCRKCTCMYNKLHPVLKVRK